LANCRTISCDNTVSTSGHTSPIASANETQCAFSRLVQGDYADARSSFSFRLCLCGGLQPSLSTRLNHIGRHLLVLLVIGLGSNTARRANACLPFPCPCLHNRILQASRAHNLGRTVTQLSASSFAAFSSYLPLLLSDLVRPLLARRASHRN
jgi:hypothetical protein